MSGGRRVRIEVNSALVWRSATVERMSVVSERAERLAWPDFARGLSIILVVLMHLLWLHYIFFFGGAPGADIVIEVVNASLPLRMPLFFLVSGYLASRALHRRWRHVSRGRVWTLVYLYVLWVVINAVFDWVRESVGTGGPVNPLRFIIDNLIWPQTALWYLYALVLFFLIARFTRAVPAALVVGIAAIVSIAGTTVFSGLTQDLMRSFVFFAVAARAPELVDGIVARARWRNLAIAAALYAAFTVLNAATSFDFGVYLLASVAAVIFGLQLSVRVGGFRWAAPVRYLGRHTLAIFLVHPFVFIVANDLLSARPGLVERLQGMTAVVIIYPWALLAATLAICVGVEALAKRIGLGFFFALPRWVLPGDGAKAGT